MLKHENLVRYLVLVVEDGVERPWFCAGRDKLRQIIDSAAIKGQIIKVIRYYPHSIAYDTILRPDYDPSHERFMIYKLK